MRFILTTAVVTITISGGQSRASVLAPGDIALIYRHHKLDKPSGEAAALVKGITAEHGLGKFTKFMIRAAQVATSRRERLQWKHFVEVVGASTLMREMPKS